VTAVTVVAAAEFLQPMTQCMMNCKRDGKENKLVYPPYMIHHSTGWVLV